MENEQIAKKRRASPVADSSEHEAKRIPPGPGSRVEHWLYTSRLTIAGVTTAYTYGVRTNIEASSGSLSTWSARIPVPPEDGFSLSERTLHLPYPYDRDREIENAREGRAGEPMRNDCTVLPGGHCWSAHPGTALGPEWRFLELLAVEPGSVVGSVAYGRHGKGCLTVPKGLGVVTAVFERTEAFWAFLEAEHRRMLEHYRPIDAFARCPTCEGCGAISARQLPRGDLG